jgi:mRNA interferase MazF
VDKPVAGEVVVIPFPQTDLTAGKRRPALVLVDLPGDDLILCQITSRARSDESSVPLDAADFERGQLARPSFILSTATFHGRATCHPLFGGENTICETG